MKPLLSLDQGEAKARVLSLYRAWFRQIPIMMDRFDMPITEEQAKKRLRERFQANGHIKDVRIIDMLVVQGQQDLKEVAEHWTEVTHIMSKFFKEQHMSERPKDFMSKFLSGHD